MTLAKLTSVGRPAGPPALVGARAAVLGVAPVALAMAVAQARGSIVAGMVPLAIAAAVLQQTLP